MKRFFAILALFAYNFITIDAQYVQGEAITSNSYYLVPRTFAYNNKASIIAPTEDEDYVNVYNDDLDVIKTFKVINHCVTYEYQTNNNGVWETTSADNFIFQPLTIYLYDLDNNNYDDCEESRFSQTLFNNDEKFEYIIPVFDKYDVNVKNEIDLDGDGVYDRRSLIKGGKLLCYKIVNEDGATLITLELNEPHLYTNLYLLSCDVIIFEGKKYIVLDDYASNKNIFYLINPETTSAEMVKSIPSFKRQVFSTDGRRIPNVRHGVNIIREKDGTVSKQFVK